MLKSCVLHPISAQWAEVSTAQGKTLGLGDVFTFASVATYISSFYTEAGFW